MPTSTPALEIARDAGIRINFVLLDHRWMFAGVRHTIADPVTGVVLEASLPHGRAHVLLSEAGRDRLFDRVFAPLVGRYAPSGERADLAPAVLAYEFMNEPDFVVEEWERDLSVHVPRPLPFEVLAEIVSRLSQLVHTVHAGRDDDRRLRPPPQPVGLGRGEPRAGPASAALVSRRQASRA